VALRNISRLFFVSGMALPDLRCAGRREFVVLPHKNT
jgi:hypothetical protein